MRFAFTDDQRLSQQTLRSLLDEACTAAHLRGAWESDAGRVPGLWDRLADFGLFGLLAPEARGGLGMSEVDMILLMEEVGRAAVPEPVLDTAFVAVPLLAGLGEIPAAAGPIEQASSGALRVATGIAGAPFVLGAETADLLLLERGSEVHAVLRDRVTLTRQRSVDRARSLFSVEWTPDGRDCLAEGDRARRLLDEAFDRGALGTAAQLVGLADRLLSTTIDYVKTREQFGRPIGSFQAVKHILVDAYLGNEFARPLVYRAAHSVAHGDPERARHISAAKAFASDAAVVVARAALQLHGAIGYSYEHELHLYMKRVWALAEAWGSASWHRNRLAGSILGEADAPGFFADPG